MFNIPNAICMAVFVAIMAAANWALVALSETMEFWSFMIFGVVLIAAIIGLSFAWDHVAARPRPSQEVQPPQPPHSPR
jgi:hypothetical protein